MVDVSGLPQLSRRRGFLGGLAAVVLIAAAVFSIYRELRKPDEKSPPPAPAVEPVKDSSARRGGAPSIDIERVQLTPVDFALPSAFFVEVRNSGLGPGDAELLIDFGPAVIDSLEYRPTGVMRITSGGRGTNAVKALVHNLSENESLYLYAFISVPRFRDITLNPIGGGLQKHLTIADVERQGLVRLPGAFKTFLWIFLAVMICIGALFFWEWLFGRLGKTTSSDSRQTGATPPKAPE